MIVKTAEDYFNLEARIQELEYMLGSGELSSSEIMSASVELSELTEYRNTLQPV